MNQVIIFTHGKVFHHIFKSAVFHLIHNCQHAVVPQFVQHATKFGMVAELSVFNAPNQVVIFSVLQLVQHIFHHAHLAKAVAQRLHHHLLDDHLCHLDHGKADHAGNDQADDQPNQRSAGKVPLVNILLGKRKHQAQDPTYHRNAIQQFVAKKRAGGNRCKLPGILGRLRLIHIRILFIHSPFLLPQRGLQCYYHLTTGSPTCQGSNKAAGDSCGLIP